ncbi:MAG: DUF502 domain-containing protein [Acidobacteria bacterium]|nr:DUF502 domain-containing protein [Acidobacteriota bacterium]MCG2816029.1 DUF502 domain-containing protein [Candidatus Aminicenantes bacterium]MBU1338934.1 DUF502 domain-containing protein [Acidobacteriota bacterium]MBU1475405.1 DUF502 domain-containing protein [Acidobacteriota bacterium]MBU2438182.1 DUF502 domain-containing protein [Acidobacteriota bacterium]
MRKRISTFFRRNFVTGLIVIIPAFVTFVIVRALVRWVNGALSVLPPQYHPRTYIPIFGIEIIIAFILILLIGVAANNFFGKKIINLSESLLARIPVIKTVYQGIKQLSTGIFSDKKIFTRVVMMEFKASGLSLIGFVTGEMESILPGREGKKVLKIFIPTTPNPTSGFFCLAAEENVTPLDISVDEAFKLIISAGYAEFDPAALQQKPSA